MTTGEVYVNEAEIARRSYWAGAFMWLESSCTGLRPDPSFFCLILLSFCLKLFPKTNLSRPDLAPLTRALAFLFFCSQIKFSEKFRLFAL
jgi:hypothetical protein